VLRVNLLVRSDDCTLTAHRRGPNSCPG